MYRQHLINDPYEKELYDNMIDAEFKYYEYLQGKLAPQFLKETQGYVMDTSHWGYKHFKTGNTNDEDIKFLSKTDRDKLKSLYRQLSIICHPDKCKEDWAEETFKFLNKKFHNNDLISLQELNTHWVDHSTFKNFQFIIERNKSKVEIIDEWKRQIWFQWFIPNSLIREVFIPKEKYIEKIKKECKDLEKENEDLRHKIKNATLS